MWAVYRTSLPSLQVQLMKEQAATAKPHMALITLACIVSRLGWWNVGRKIELAKVVLVTTLVLCRSTEGQAGRKRRRSMSQPQQAEASMSTPSNAAVFPVVSPVQPEQGHF